MLEFEFKLQLDIRLAGVISPAMEKGNRAISIERKLLSVYRVTASGCMYVYACVHIDFTLLFISIVCVFQKYRIIGL